MRVTGVHIHCNARVRALHGDARSGRVRAVLTEDGGEFAADLVIVGVGVVPTDELAKAFRSRLRERRGHRRALPQLGRGASRRRATARAT